MTLTFSGGFFFSSSSLKCCSTKKTKKKISLVLLPVFRVCDSLTFFFLRGSAGHDDAISLFLLLSRFLLCCCRELPSNLIRSIIQVLRESRTEREEEEEGEEEKGEHIVSVTERDYTTTWMGGEGGGERLFVCWLSSDVNRPGTIVVKECINAYFLLKNIKRKKYT